MQYKGESLHLVCIVSGNEIPNIIWYKNDRQIKQGNKYKISHTKEVTLHLSFGQKEAMKSDLELKVNEHDQSCDMIASFSGSYKCKAGKEEHMEHLEIQCKYLNQNLCNAK